MTSDFPAQRSQNLIRRTRLLVLAAVATGSLVCHGLPVPCAGAAESAQQIYKAIGGPTEPRVNMRWNHYHDYAQASGVLRNLVAAYPQFAKLESAGKSHEGATCG